MKIGIGGIYHETNTFSATRTGIESFKRNYFIGVDMIENLGKSSTSIGGFISSAEKNNDVIIPVLYTAATPSATISKKAFRKLVNDFFHSTDDWEKMDAFLLAQHGAMSVEDNEDAEGYFIKKVKRKLGERPLVVTVDYHANISEKMICNCASIVGYDTYPHVDIFERAVDAYRIVKAINSTAKHDCLSNIFLKLPILGVPQAISTEEGVFKQAMEKVHYYEEDPDIANITLCGGYVYADRKSTGISIVASYWGESGKAKRAVVDIGKFIWDNRERITVENTGVREALAQASASADFPVILVDVADNVGGGTPGDGTVILKGLLDREMVGSVVYIADPEAVNSCMEKGVGKNIKLKIGGKTDDVHGGPVQVDGYIDTISDGEFTNIGKNMTGMKTKMGKSVLLIAGGIKIVLTQYPTPPFDPGMFLKMGIDPGKERYVVVKGAVAWKTGINTQPARAIYVDTPGLCSADLNSFDYRMISRPVFPLDEFDFIIEDNIKYYSN